MTDETERKTFDERDIDDCFAYWHGRGRDDFPTFRQLQHPNMKWGWWTKDVASELQRFYSDLVEGRRPIVALMAPPQFGKSSTVNDFAAWCAGKDPDLKTIFASYSDELGTAANSQLRRTVTSPTYQAIFPETRIGSGWSCNSSLVEYVGHAGSFRNTTVRGGINGFGLHLGIIDDPVKGALEANSKIIRDATWQWFADDYFNRFAEKSGLLIVMTRWHVDDLLGRLIDKFGNRVKALPYPAIAEKDSKYRLKGEPLFPELKSLEFLLERKKIESQASWQSLYQQNPIIVGGGQLPIEKLRVVPYWDRKNIAASIRYWDKAASSDSERGAYTAGVLMHRLYDKTHVIEHIARGRWGALEREQHIKATAQSDGQGCYNYEVWIEQEPGSGGKESAEYTIRNLAGFRVRAEKVTGSKEVRAQPFAAQVQAGNISLVAGPHVQPFFDECEAWPHGTYLDQVDAAAGAFNQLANQTRYNTNFKDWAY